MALDARNIVQMQLYQPLGCFHDEEPEEYPADAENDWPSRVVIVDGVAGYVPCPDCMADERITDAELLDPTFDGDHTWAQDNGRPANCILCKDTGKLWVSI